MKIFESLDEFAAAAGTDLGSSEWFLVDQDRVNLFADATDDHQWIHVDLDRAASGPFGGPIAHGLLTLSLLPVLVQGVYRVDGVSMGVNYGYNKVRFISPVPVGSRLRASASVVDVSPVAGGVQGTLSVTVEIEGAAKPACVAESIVRYLA